MGKSMDIFFSVICAVENGLVKNILITILQLAFYFL